MVLCPVLLSQLLFLALTEGGGTKMYRRAKKQTIKKKNNKQQILSHLYLDFITLQNLLLLFLHLL